MSIPGSPNLLLMRKAAPAAPVGFQIPNSCRLNPADSAYLHLTPSSSTCRQIWTWSGWFKRSQVASTSTNQQKLFSCKDTDIYIEADKMCFGNSGANNLVTSQVLKDYSSWYHLVVIVDTTQGTANDRQRMFINGKEVTAFSTRSNLSEGASTDVNLGSNVHRIGANKNTTHFFGGYFSDMHLIDGMALNPANFGEFSSTTGDFNPKEFALQAVNDGTTWSSKLSGSFDGSNNAAKAFDGDLSTYAYPAPGNTVTFTPDDPIACTTLRVYARNDANGGGVKVNGIYQGDITTTPTWYDYTPDSHSITTISWRRESSGSIGCQVYAIEINGIMMLDGVTDRTTAVNNGTVWSDNITVSGSSSDAEFAKIVDGNLATNVYCSAGNVTATGTFSPKITYTNKIRVYGKDHNGPSNTYKLYINGTMITQSGSPGWTDVTSACASAGGLETVKVGDGNGNWSTIYAIEVDGQILMDGAEGLHGKNGFKLWSNGFSASSDSDVGKDYSGETNNYTPVNLSYTADLLTDTPNSYGTGTAGGDVRGNFCTLNALQSDVTSLIDGNLDYTNTGGWKEALGTIGVTSGKWYYEVECVGGDGDGNSSVGFAWKNNPGQTGAGSVDYAVMIENSGWVQNFSTGKSNEGIDIDEDDVLGVSLDLDAGTPFMRIWVNNAQQHTINLGGTWSAEKTLFPYVNSNNTGARWRKFNFGQRAWQKTCPSGYKALCTANFATPTVEKPTDQFKAIQYPGSSSAQTIKGLDFQPNFVWIKGVDKDQGHILQNTERGSGKGLQSNNNSAEFSSSNMVSDFNSDGFDLGTDAAVSESGKTYVSWSWNVPTDFSNSAGSNGASLASTGQVNTTAGISVVVYTGTSAAATVYHGLTREPYMIFTKPLESASGASGNDWRCYHRYAADSNPWQKYVILNSSGSINTWLDWNNTQPTSSVFSVGGMNTTWTTCENNIDYIAYCFAPVAGYSAMGLYTGSSGEPFVYTGFRPAFFLLKRRDNSASWYIFDNARDPYNEVTGGLRPNSNVVEQAYNVSFLSNGVLIESSSDGDINGSGAGYMWYAVAESPFKTARAR